MAQSILNFKIESTDEKLRQRRKTVVLKPKKMEKVSIGAVF